MKMPRKKTELIKETQMVSLADIAFLIIFFFMLSSQFMRDKLVVDLPVVPMSTQTDSSYTVTMDADKQIFLEGDPIDSGEMLESNLRGLLAGRTDSKSLEVRFKCDRSLTFKDYKAVLESISNAGGVIAVMHDVAQP